MSKEFDGRTALVTGGGSGIGRAAAVALASKGCTVTVVGRTARKLEETVRIIENSGGSAGYEVCDVADEEALAAAVSIAAGTNQRLDFAVNCAGVDGDGPESTADFAMAKFDRMIATNVRGVFLSMKYELQQMEPRKAGSIVNISSGAGLVGVPRYAAYCASKWAEIGMTKSAAVEYASRGIRINAICPGLVNTPLFARTMAERREHAEQLIAGHPIGRIAQPNEIADAVVWLCSDRASYVVGAALPLDGGYTAQ